jgi:hypothetical protein
MRTGKPFTAWVELEETHANVCRYRPDLIDKLYEVAKKEVTGCEFSGEQKLLIFALV